MQKARDRELQEAVGISTAMSGVLLFIHLLGRSASVSELARWITKDPNNISQLVTRMEKLRLVRRIEHSVGRTSLTT